MHTLMVTAKTHSYPIYIGHGLLSNAELLNQYVNDHQVFIVTNQTIADLYLKNIINFFIKKQCDYLVLPEGEEHKNITIWSQIIEELMKKHHRRSTTMIALGGGVIGDITGFAAACYQRGVNFLQLPTSLLAQVDASIGGKTAINHSLAKNMVGAFYPPKAVFIDISTLKTLPKRQLAAGFAEIIKYALIADATFFDWLEKNQKQLLTRDEGLLETAILRSCKIKAAIVSGDEDEQAERALLNFGHTFAHAIEVLTGYNTFLHGEAVAIGMVLACQLSVELHYISPETVERVKALLSALDLPIALPVACMPALMLNKMQHDKKATDAGLRLIVLQELGKAKIVENIATEQINTVLKMKF